MGERSTDIGVGVGAAEVKQCCSRLYEGDLARYLLGDSFHPGGPDMTRRLGELLSLRPGELVVDVASGMGTSALLLAEHVGVRVIGVDLSAVNVARASQEAASRGLADLVSFRCGDAEDLPVDDASVDAVVCECAFCTFPDKGAAAREFARVLRPGGRMGMSDITREPGPAGEFDDLTAWIACLADAMPADAYADWLRKAGLKSVTIERHDEVLMDMVRSVGTRLLAADVLAGLNAVNMSGVDLAAAKRLANQALTAARERRLGYAVVLAIR
jgi:arsenite methyltransferase